MTIARVLPTVTRRDADHRLVRREAVAIRSGSSDELNSNCTSPFGARLLAQHEVAAPQRAAAQLGELRVVAAGVTHAIGAGRELEVFGQRELVELHGVRARVETFEVEAAVFVGHAVAAVFEIHANPGDAGVFAASLVASAFEHAARR